MEERQLEDAASQATSMEEALRQLQAQYDTAQQLTLTLTSSLADPTQRDTEPNPNSNPNPNRLQVQHDATQQQLGLALGRIQVPIRFRHLPSAWYLSLWLWNPGLSQ